MSRWCTLTSLLVLWAANPAVILAQSAPGTGYSPAAYPPGGAAYPTPYDGVTPAGWSSHQTPDRYGAVKYKNQRGQYGPNGSLPAGPGRTLYEELPDDRGFWYDDAPIDRFLTDAFRHAYFRVDYLLWDISDPGDSFLGAGSNYTSAGVPANFQTVFPLPDADSGAVLDVYQARLGNVLTNENNGIRGTFGMPIFNAGTLEASVFGLQSSISDIQAPGVRTMSSTLIDTNGDGFGDTAVSVPLVDAVVQGVLINGQMPQGNNFLLFNGIDTDGDGAIDTPAYQATLKTQVWGTEGNFLFEPNNPNANLQISPFVGVRYLNFRETLRQIGQYEDALRDENGEDIVDPVTGITQTQRVTRRIDSSAINNMFGPQIGMRAELRSKWFAIGAQPKVMLGVNTFRANLETERVLRIDDPSQSITDKDTTFGVIGDLEVYSRVYIGDHLSAFVGYNFMWAGMLTRPGDNIVYNVNTASADAPIRSAFNVDPKFSGAIMQGLSIGAQLEY